jgi:oxygen-independent coproporphyrinogen-3 oxidase
MKIIIEGSQRDEIPEFYIQAFSLLFFPGDNIFGRNSESGNYIKLFANKNKDIIEISAKICYNKKTAEKSGRFASGAAGDYLTETGKLFYEAASGITGVYPPWGIHTGIRPAKLAANMSTEELRCDYLMDEKKAKLAVETHNNGKAAAGAFLQSDFSLYVSIPFCPSRCRYCSFVSFATPGLLKLIPEYIKKLAEEIELAGKIARGRKLRSVYIGGGTPSTLDLRSIEIILNAVKNNFDMNDLTEYTVECGRPDTITAEKLELMKSSGVDRISVNPQTLNDDILNKIGRKHTAGEFFAAFELARKAGIKNINADCIIGLPGEPEESMIRTIEALAGLGPENITVHSLCIKKASELRSEKYNMTHPAYLNGVLEKSYDILREAGYKPYYLYRQKYAAGNLENTGFCLENRECVYNIYMMDELQTIFGVGAGAITKLVKDGRIERIANYKYPYEYIGRDFQINREKNKIKLKMLEE